MVEKVWDDPEVYRIPVRLPDNPLRALNSYVVRTATRTLIIDTGFDRPECRSDLFDGLERLEVDWDKAILFLTHFHSDHIGLVWDFVQRGVPVYMGRLEHQYYLHFQDAFTAAARDSLIQREGFSAVSMSTSTQDRANFYEPRFDFPVVEIEDQACLPIADLKVQCICTPGHTPGHMVLYLPESQILFSGDHVLFDITPNISVWPDVEDPLGKYMNSLQSITQLPIRYTFPAHRATSTDVCQRVQYLLAHHEERLGEIRCMIAAQPGLNAYEIAGRMPWSAHGLQWSQFPPHQQWFATVETMAHLHHLTAEGQLVRIEKFQDVRYFPA